MATATARPQAVARTRKMRVAETQTAAARRRFRGAARAHRAGVMLGLDCAHGSCLPGVSSAAGMRHGQTGVPLDGDVGQTCVSGPACRRWPGSARSRALWPRARRSCSPSRRSSSMALAASGVGLVLLHEDERGAGDRPGGGAGLVDEHQVHARAGCPSSRRSAAAAAKLVDARLDPRAVLVLQLRGGHAGLLGVGVLHVADRAAELLHAGGDALVALAADADRPGDLLVGAGRPHVPARRR